MRDIPLFEGEDVAQLLAVMPDARCVGHVQRCDQPIEIGVPRLAHLFSSIQRVPLMFMLRRWSVQRIWSMSSEAWGMT